MSSFSFIGHVWKFEHTPFGDIVWLNNQNGSFEIHFDLSVGAENVLADYLYSDMLSYLVSIEGIILGGTDFVGFDGKSIRVI